MDNYEIYLAEEIIINILKRLPVKSLIQFQCVCQLWKTLIKRPSFIMDHLQHYCNRNPYRLLEFTSYSPPLCMHPSLHLLDCDFKVHEFPKPPLNNIVGGRIVCSCNGLLLVNYGNDKDPDFPLSLWNPATNSSTFVPRLTTHYHEVSNWVTGFVLCPSDNDYKIVRFYANKDFNTISLVEVFSFRRSSWKGVHVENLEGVKVKRKETVTLGGVIFWIGVKGMRDDEVIVSFDIAKEVFTLIPTPIFLTTNTLTIYENKLAMLYDVSKNLTELWVLLEDGSCASGKTLGIWNLEYIGSPFPKGSYPLCTWKNEILSRCPYENVLNLVNLTTKEEKRLVVPFHDGNVKCFYDYVESLIWVNTNDYVES